MASSPHINTSPADQGATFLQAILEDPGDKTPRLIYADWLDAQGQSARAEFFRLGCELETLVPGTAAYKALYERYSQLHNENGAEWRPSTKSNQVRLRLHKGLYDSLCFTHDINREDDAMLFDPTFPIWSVGLEKTGTYLPNDHEPEEQIAILGRLDQFLKDLASHGKKVPRLELNLSPMRLANPQQNAGAIAQKVAELIPNDLEEFSYTRNSIIINANDENAATICRALPRDLKKLEFRGNGLTGMRARIERIQHFMEALPPRLESLDLSYNSIGDDMDGIEESRIMAQHLPPTLKHLRLSHNHFGDQAIQHIDERGISRERYNSANEKIDALLEHLPAGLESLDISNTGIEIASGFRDIVESIVNLPLSHLTSLSAVSNPPEPMEKEAWKNQLSKAYKETIRSQGQSPSLVSLEVLNDEELEGEIAELRNKARKAYEKRHPGVFKEKPDTPGPDEPPAYPSLATTDEDEDDTPDRPTPEPRVTSDDIWWERSRQAKGGGK